MCGHLKSNSGTTMVEITVALIVLGIAMAVLVPNFTGTMHRALKDRIPAELESDVQEAMSEAKSQGRTLCVVFQEDGYVIRDLADSTIVLRSRSFGDKAKLEGSGNPLIFPWGIVQQTTVRIYYSGEPSAIVTVLPTGRLETQNES